ncbi:hypothetical protein F5Y13DRAFT_190826 [Hypoxylon sp. FL1857]|nr:hypothetical protein F5Y13DRAFT_190826 [Hypoxylon sp. FL1857]
MVSMEDKASIIANVLAQLSKFENCLDACEYELESKALDDGIVEEVKKWQKWQWEKCSIQVFKYSTTSPELKADISRAMDGLSRLDSRICRLLDKNQKKNGESQTKG